MENEEVITMSEAPVHDWFELSYSSYLVLPRALMSGMPVEWQRKFVDLLIEAQSTYDSEQIGDNYTVLLKDDEDNVIKDPLADYKYPPELPYKNKSKKGSVIKV